MTEFQEKLAKVLALNDARLASIEAEVIGKSVFVDGKFQVCYAIAFAKETGEPHEPLVLRQCGSEEEAEGFAKIFRRRLANHFSMMWKTAVAIMTDQRA